MSHGTAGTLAAEDRARARSLLARPIEAEALRRHLGQYLGPAQPTRARELLVDGLGPASDVGGGGKEAGVARHPAHGPGVVVVHLSRIPDRRSRLVAPLLAGGRPARSPIPGGRHDEPRTVGGRAGRG